MPKVTKIEASAPLIKPRLKVAAYARVSKDTEMLLHSLSAQVSYYSDLIQKNPAWEYVGVYADCGVTGTSTQRREQFNRMVADCEAGKIQLVLTKSISRFARNTVDLLETVRHLRDIGVEVRFERERISSMSGDGELMLTILASFAEAESLSLSDNIKWKVRKGFQAGKQHSRQKMLGYRWEGDDLVIVPEEAEIVRLIFEKYIAGLSPTEIANLLKENGMMGVHGKPLPKWSVRAVLENEEYTGVLILQKNYNTAPHRERKNYGEVQMYKVEDNHPAIISAETFRKAQAVKAERDERYTHKPENDTCFTGKVRCGKCGHACSAHVHYYRSSRKPYYTFLCNNRGHNNACDCKGFAMSRMRKAAASVLGREDFDEEFSERVRVVRLFDEKLEFEFKDGRVATWQKE